MHTDRFKKLMIHLVLAIGSILMLYPLIFSLMGSITNTEDYLRSTWIPIPSTVFLNNYQAMFSAEMLPTLAKWMGITTIRIVWFTFLPIIVAILCGYVFSRLKFRGREAAFLVILSSMLVPQIVFQVPLFVLMARWPLAGGNDWLGQGGTGFIGQLPALLLPGIVNAYFVFLMRQVFFGIPDDYEEAARLDGANTFQVLRYVYIPMLRSAIIVMVILNFVGIWNDYVWPLMVVGPNRDMWPVGLAFQKIMGGSFQIPDIGNLSSAGVSLVNIPLLLTAGAVVTIPPVLIFFIFQRYFIQGLQGIGLKG